MTKLKMPYFPIIYVRGYAMTSAEIADTVATPYMGFNLGSTKVRQAWDGQVERHIFESPLVRLMKDYGYSDIYAQGTEIKGPIPARSVIIYRYYESADKDLGQGDDPQSIIEAATNLGKLIHQIRKQVCGGDKALEEQFRVHLVAHSMGGLVCRSFLQNDEVSSEADRALVDKVFTYATPHNGIEVAGRNVPLLLGLWDINNFNRTKMARFLGMEGKPERVDSLQGKFDSQRFFCFVGTNHQDYTVARGLSRLLAGEMSDGLVQIKNASVQNSPRAFAYRSHSGPFGVVNSEEGYQNLVRFLFGDMRVDGVMEVEALPLPPSVEKAKTEGRKIRASYYFEASVAPRGYMNFKLTERRQDTNSAVLRTFDELMRLENTGHDQPRSPFLFSAFLDTRKITVGKTVVFSVELAVSANGYNIDNKLWLDRFVEGEYLYRDTLTIRITPTEDGWNVRYLNTDERWSERMGSLAEEHTDGFVIPLSSKKGFKAKLWLKVRQVIDGQLVAGRTRVIG